MSPLPISPARLLSSRSHHVPGKLIVTELFFEVPLDHADPNGSEKLRIFCRAAEKFEKPAAPPVAKAGESKDGKEGDGDGEKLPWFVYIPGGPGFGAPPPQNFELTRDILARGYKFLAFDHRGIGLSTTATAATVAAKGNAQQQAAYLQYFRADNAVRDLEAIRLCLTADYPPEKQKWSIMGQSYGGYVCLNYLSAYPEGLREAFPLGGLAPITQRTPDEPIRRLFRKLKERNERYYEKFPEDVDRVKELVRHIEENKPVLPSGIPLTARRFLQLGIHFGFHGGLDTVHEAVLRAGNDLDTFGFLTRPTLSEFDGFPGFDDHVIYALMHGPLYVQGQKSDWVFDRVLGEFAEFAIQTKDGARQLFTGEMVFKCVFDDNVELRTLKDTAELLESKSDWPALYDLEQLRKNEVPVYAAVFIDDMYVDVDFSLETARIVKGTKTFVTNVLYHDAIRSKSAEVLKGVFDLRDDSID